MSQASSFTANHQWDARTVLQIHGEKECEGNTKGGAGPKCRNRISVTNRDLFDGLLNEMSGYAMDADLLQTQPHSDATSATIVPPLAPMTSRFEDRSKQWKIIPAF